MVQLKLFLFGQPRLERAGAAVQISLHKALALLAYLAVTKQAHSRDALAALFWPESDATIARANLRRTLYALNKTIGESILSATQQTASLDPRAELWLDVDTFSAHIRACPSPADTRGELTSECLSHLTQATLLYADDFLAGFTLPDSPAFDEWQFFEGERLRREFARALDLLVQAHHARGEFDQAIGYARRQLALDPLHEPAHRQLMQLYAWSGQQPAALRQYQQCLKILEEELGTSPQPETTELYESIRQGQVSLPLPSSAHPDVRYVQNGGVHIAYLVMGNGPVDVIFVGGWIGHLEQMWEEPDLARFYQRLASFARLILFDKRGVGLSDRVGYPPTLENTMDDILAVMDAVGSTRAVLVGASEGGTSSALFAATHSERVAGLILYGTLAKGTRSEDYPWALTTEQYDTWLGEMMKSWGGPISLEYFAPSRAEDERFRQWYSKSLRLASSPGEVKAVLEVVRDIDVRVALPSIRVPTLVLHRAGDKAVRVGNGRFIASQIPGAKYLELAGDDHLWWVGDADSILMPIESFLKELGEPVVSDRMLATILGIELATGNRSQGASVQQQAASSVYGALLSRHVARFRGREMSKGDQHSIILFDGPTRAIQCASAICTAARQVGLTVRAGLHTGECAVTNEGVAGAAIQSTVAIMEKAAPGEVLVSGTVKDLVIGSGFTFANRGTFRMERPAGKQQAYAVDLRIGEE